MQISYADLSLEQTQVFARILSDCLIFVPNILSVGSV